jgi:hypothetical protein
MSSPTLMQIVSTDGKEHVVDLEKRTCSCTRFQEYQAPCSHAIVAARHQYVDPYSLFDHAYTLVSYRYMYRIQIFPMVGTISNGMKPYYRHW